MEISQRNQTENVKLLDTWIWRAKIAIALSIIQSKPPDVTDEEYIVHLACKMHRQQEETNQRCQALEKNVLFLKQKLLIMEFGGEGDSSPETSGIQSESDTLSTDEHLMKRRSENKLQNSTHFEKQERNSTPELTVKHHTNFFTGLLSLKSNMKAANCETVRISDVSVQDTIIESLQGLLEFISSDVGFELKDVTLEEALDVVKKLFHSTFLDSYREKLQNICENFVKSVAKAIMESTDINQHYLQDRRSYILSSLAKSVALVESVFETLLTEVIKFSTHLRDCDRTGLTVEPASFENVFYILQTLEDILKILASDLSIQEQVSIKKNVSWNSWHRHLDQASLYITEKYPLFAVSIWNVQFQLECMIAE
ncbi:meiosis-specific protein MEI4-like [Tachypleus tridentatus]|uniref:meiosis-specific protein MEI4-like n=1 Tax=Tachypleus tridentatus TaxID=6853 RepID=UPI003FCFECDC